MNNPIATCIIEKTNEMSHSPKILDAAKVLSGAAFKLFIYLNTLPAGIHLYERIKVSKLLNISGTTLNVCFDELIKNGYLILTPKNFYKFSLKEENIQEHAQGDNIYTESMKEQ